jgi:hypothetical protein
MVHRDLTCALQQEYKSWIKIQKTTTKYEYSVKLPTNNIVPNKSEINQIRRYVIIIEAN